MLEYDYIKVLNDYARVFKAFPLPVILADNEWNVYWSNSRAKSFYAHLTDTRGLQAALSEFSRLDILSQLEQAGNCVIKDVVSLGNVSISLSPIDFGGESSGVLIMLMGDETVPDISTFFKTSQTASTLSKGIRESINEIFSIMDVASAKAELMNMNWINPSFRQIGLNNYRILRQVSNLNEYAKYQANGVQLQQTTVNLFSLLREWQDTLHGIFCSMEIPITMHIPSGDCFVRLDLSKFEIAFFNILHNSLYFTRPGNEIYLTAEREQSRVMLMVHDHGTGIPKQVMPHIFRPFFHYAPDGSSAGVGLGLTLAQTILEAHGGSLTLQSQTGEGTSAIMTIPENMYSQNIHLAQEHDHYDLVDRFSHIYVNLSDAVLSPYRTS